MKVREKTLQNYLEILLKNQRIKEFLVENGQGRNSSSFRPKLTIVDQVSKNNASQYAGMAVSSTTIQVSNWICVDKEQAFSTVRHELAHCIQAWCSLPGSHHGSGFTIALKLVSPRTWRNDRHWKRTAEVEKARQEVNNRVWSSVDTRKYYIQIDNGSKFAWRQLTFDQIIEEFKQDPRKLWTRGIHCTRIHIAFQCPNCSINLYPKTPGSEATSWRFGKATEDLDTYFLCPKCNAQNTGILSLVGRKNWSGTLEEWVS